jgi:hypothetical protein
MVQLSRLFAPKEREFFDLFEEAGEHRARVRPARANGSRNGPSTASSRGTSSSASRGATGSRRHHPAPQPHVRHPDRLAFLLFAAGVALGVQEMVTK